MSSGPHTSHRGLRRLAAAATATTFVLIAVGALVRATGSGLGCTGWPKCSEHRWLPPLEHHALIEYTHRMTAFVDVILVALLAVLAWRRYRAERRVFRPAIAAAVLVVFQAALGGIVVKGDLHALLVTAHFMTAMVLAGTLVVATVAALSIGLPASPIRSMDRVARLASLTAAGLFALLGVGAYVRGEGAGLAFGDWPLMGGRLIPRLSHLAAALHFAHRALALAVFVLALLFVVAAWRARSQRPAVARLALVAVGLFAAQIVVGAANVWSHLAPAAVTAHVAVAGLLWGTVVATAEASRLSAPRPREDGVVLPADPSSSFVESHAGTVRP
jgi:cytochrome c oxidase assembly protein subunit 15